MVSVEFWYKGFLGKLKGVSCQFPENWEEADERFVLLYAKYLIDGNANGIWDLIVEYAQLTPKIITANGSRGLLELKLLPLLDNILTKKVISERTFIASIKLKNQALELVGPRNEFFQMRVGQYMLANTYVQEYAQSKDVKYLDALVTCLYIPEFEVFNEQLATSRILLVKDIDLAIKKAVYLNFIAMLEWLAASERYGSIFKQTDESSGYDTGYDLSDVVFELSGPKLGTVNDVEQLQFIYFLERVITRPKTEAAA